MFYKGPTDLEFLFIKKKIKIYKNIYTPYLPHTLIIVCPYGDPPPALGSSKAATLTSPLSKI